MADPSGGLFPVLDEKEVDSVTGPRLDSPPPQSGDTSPLPGSAGGSPTRTGSLAAPAGRAMGRSRSSAVRFTNKAAADSSPLLQKPNRTPIAEETATAGGGTSGMILATVAIQGWRKTMEDHHVIGLRNEDRVANEVAVVRCKTTPLPGGVAVGVSPPLTSIALEGAPLETSVLDVPEQGHPLVLELPFEAFLGVYDGHQNANTSHFLKQRLHTLLLKELQPLAQLLGSPANGAVSGEGSPNSTVTDGCTTDTHTTASSNNTSFPSKDSTHGLDAGALAAIQHAFNTAFTMADEEHRNQTGVVHGGSTVGCCIVTTHYILLANLGDCRAAVLSGQGCAVSLDKEHRLGVNEEEKQRVILTGTSVDKDRVGGILAVSRAMGDYIFKPLDKPVEMRPVSAHPEVMVIPRSDEQEFVLVGCDGVWELQSVSSIQEMLQGCSMGTEQFGVETVYRIVNTCSSSSVAMHDKASVQPGCDNVTLGILKLK